MIEQEILIRGGIYLAKLNPAKTNEVGKVRPVIVLNSQIILNSTPPMVFICPLSKTSHPEFDELHIKISARDKLEKTSHSLVEHIRSISVDRITFPRLAQITEQEITAILHKLNILIDNL